MTIRKKLLIIFSIGLVLTIIGLTTGILWFMIYSSILNTVDIKKFYLQLWSLVKFYILFYSNYL